MEWDFWKDEGCDQKGYLSCFGGSGCDPGNGVAEEDQR